MKLPMRHTSAFCLFIIFGNLQSQKLIGFEVSKCLTDCKFEKSTIDLKTSEGQTEILLRTLANCNGDFLGKIKSRNGILNLTFESKPVRGIDENGKKAWYIEVASCDCPFDFTYIIKGLELKDPAQIRVNGLILSELPSPFVEEIIVEQTKVEQELEEKEDESRIYTILEEQAAPVGGMSTFYKYVREALNYPLQAKEKRVEGRVFCEFVVNSDGTIQDVKIIRGIGAGCDEEAIRIIQAATPWIPGKQRGKPVRSKFNLAIVFKLNEMKE
jgi:TonB family protein